VITGADLQGCAFILSIAWVTVAWIKRNRPPSPWITVNASGGGAGVRVGCVERLENA
jgi:hypothetical protein